jgi:uncharacterized membrane protein
LPAVVFHRATVLVAGLSLLPIATRYVATVSLATIALLQATVYLHQQGHLTAAVYLFNSYISLSSEFHKQQITFRRSNLALSSLPLTTLYLVLFRGASIIIGLMY